MSVTLTLKVVFSEKHVYKSFTDSFKEFVPLFYSILQICAIKTYSSEDMIPSENVKKE